MAITKVFRHNGKWIFTYNTGKKICISAVTDWKGTRVRISAENKFENIVFNGHEARALYNVLKKHYEK